VPLLLSQSPTQQGGSILPKSLLSVLKPICDARKGLLRGVAHVNLNQPLLSWYEISVIDNMGSNEVPSWLGMKKGLAAMVMRCLHIQIWMFTQEEPCYCEPLNFCL
jgi:hypothetical protein